MGRNLFSKIKNPPHEEGSTRHLKEPLFLRVHDNEYPSRPGFKPGTPRLQAPVDTNVPSGPATINEWRNGVSGLPCACIG